MLGLLLGELGNYNDAMVYLQIAADGMPDQWEIDHFGSADAVNGGPTDDWDDDGADNLSEYIADTRVNRK